MSNVLTSGLIMGLVATLAMDLWAIALNRAVGQPLPNWAMVGRWSAGLAGGKVFHDAIAEAPPVAGETALGWAVHYGVGILYGIVFAILAGNAWLAAPSFLPAWIFAVITVAAGWFLLQPGLGLGWAAANAPSPWKVRAHNLMAHTVFGAGLWGAALLI